MTTEFKQIILKIITEQELIIGPIAWSEAKKVPGLKVIDPKTGEIELEGDPKAIVDRLVAQYERLFGRASHEVCREAVSALITDMQPAEVPVSLR